VFTPTVLVSERRDVAERLTDELPGAVGLADDERQSVKANQRSSHRRPRGPKKARQVHRLKVLSTQCLQYGAIGGDQLALGRGDQARLDRSVTTRAAGRPQSREEKFVGSASGSLPEFASIQAMAPVVARSLACSLVRKTSRSRNLCERVRVPSSATIATRER